MMLCIWHIIRIIRELAEKGDCVFVGRCADYILEQAKIDHISLFIAAPFEWRVKRKMEQLSIDEKSATAMVRKKGQRQKSLLRLLYRQKLGKAI